MFKNNSENNKVRCDVGTASVTMKNIWPAKAINGARAEFSVRRYSTHMGTIGRARGTEEETCARQQGTYTARGDTKT